MAGTIGCDLCQQEPAQMMQSNLTNGETISVGAMCMITFFAGSLIGMIGQLSDDDKRAVQPVLSGLAGTIGLLPADEIPAQPPAAEGNHYYADGVPAHPLSDDDQLEADSMAVDQSDAMVAEE